MTHSPYACARFLLMQLVVSGFVVCCHAQTTEVGSNTARPIPGAAHDFVRLLSETVNPANGSVAVNIGIPTPKGRGISLPFSFTYNSGQVNHFMSALPGAGGLVPDSMTSLSSGGWSDSLPYATASFWSTQIPLVSRAATSCNFSNSYTFYDPSGGTHMLGLAAVSPPQGANGNAVGGNFCNTFGFGSSLAGGDERFHSLALENCNGLAVTNSIVSPQNCNYATFDFTVTGKDGAVYMFPYFNVSNLNESGGSNGNANTAFLFPTSIEDSNGNLLGLSMTSNHARSVTDTLGRTVISSNGGIGNATSYSVGGLSYAITYTPTTAQYTLPTNPLINSQSSTVGCNANLTIPAPAVVTYPIADTGVAKAVQAITLPNGTAYTFHYDNPYGLMSEIDYPEGGWVKYTWKLNDTFSDTLIFSGISGGNSVPGGCNVQYKTLVLASRSVGMSTSPTPVETQSFIYATLWDATSPLSWDSKTTTVQTTDNATGKSQQIVYTYGATVSPNNSSPGPIPVETNVAYYDWSSASTPVKTVQKTWADPYEMTSEKTVFANGLSSERVLCYQGYTDDPTEVDEFDFGVSSPSYTQWSPSNPSATTPQCGQTSPTRKTTYKYQLFSSAPTTPSSFYTNNVSGEILNKPCQVQRYDKNNSLVSETDLLYDNASSVCGGGSGTAVAVAGLPANTHDESLFGPNSMLSRGNLTRTVQASSVTQYTYDETGQLLTATDPCGSAGCSMSGGNGHTIVYSYADNPAQTANTNAYATSITGPATNNVSHVALSSYDYVSGNVLSSTDGNGLLTTYQYNDSLRRLTDVYGPPSAQNGAGRPHQSFIYTDGKASTIKTIDAGGMASTSLVDGLGRVVQTQLNTDPSGTDYVDTSFNVECPA